MKEAFLGIILGAHKLWLSGAGEKADLRNANLSWANLRNANLSGANRIIWPQRSDGYLFAFCTAEKIVIAGCRRMTLDEYFDHIKTYNCDKKRKETAAILNYFVEMTK